MGKSSSSTNEFKPPSYTQQPWQDYLKQAQTMAATPLGQWQGQQTAPLSGMQVGGLQQLTDFTQGASPERLASGQAIVGAATGGAANPYAGMNPYLSQMIDSSNAKIADRYKSGTAAQNDAMHARSGTFGGSAWQDAASRNEQDLASALAGNTNNLLGQNYNQSAQLAESDLNRRLQAAGTGIGQQGADLSAIMSQIGAGAIPTQNYQQMLDAAQNYFAQGQQQPYTQMDFWRNALQAASGTGGSSTTINPGQSLGANLGGLGALGYGLYQGG